MSRRGFSLLEMMLVVAIMTVVMGVLAGLAMGIGRTASAQSARTAASEDARMAMEVLVARVRGAAMTTINTGGPAGGDVLRFRVAEDLDGIGSAMRKNGTLALGSEITIQPDTADLNGDGVTNRQLVMIQDGVVQRVLCNLLPPDSAREAGAAPLVRGFWVTPVIGGLNISIQTEGRDNRGQAYRVALTEFVMPRN